MTTKKPTAAERLKALTKATPKIQKINKRVQLNPVEKKEDRRKYNRGIPGKAGRPPGGMAEQRRLRRQLLEDDLDELVEMQVTDKKTGKTAIVKVPKVVVANRKIFQMGTQGVGDMTALKEFNDRALGKAEQVVVGDDDNPIVLRIDF